MDLIDRDGNFRMGTQNDWFYKHRSNPAPNQGEYVAIRTHIIVPLRRDILLGREKLLHTHLDNVCFRKFAKRYTEEYDETPRNDRILVQMKVSPLRKCWTVLTRML